MTDYLSTRFLNVPEKKITIEKIQAFIEDETTKRINFATSHAGALSRSDQGGKIILPFNDTIGPIIEHVVEHSYIFPSKFEDGGYYRIIHTDDEYNKFADFVLLYNHIVFLRDHLELSLALSMNFSDDDSRSEIGELVNIAKYRGGKDAEKAESTLIEICKDWIDKLPYYKNADYICSMPCSNKEEESLPRRIVKTLTELEDISDRIYWTSKKRKIKSAATVDEKLIILEESELVISDEFDLTGKTILLFDDLYMSGVSMQYVAMKLKEAGARKVFGLCIVKSRNNTTSLDHDK